MITTPTVFVLGAGASMPYGYPSGYGLLKDIFYNIQDDKTLSDLLFDLEIDGGVDQFRYALLRSRRLSVDSFLEHWPRYNTIGKLAIASRLCHCEKKSLKKFDNLDNENDWYKYIFDKMNTSFDDFDNNQVSFITFNYDRSLEYYLFEALFHAYQHATKEECAKKLKNIPIIHMYGKLENLPWETWKKGSQREYGTIPKYNELLKTSNGIKIIHEIDEFYSNKTKNLLNDAEDIIFIGLNLLNRTNLDRLQIRGALNLEPKLNSGFLNKNVYATCFGLENAEKESINAYFKNKYGLILGSQKEDGLLFLRRHVKLY